MYCGAICSNYRVPVGTETLSDYCGKHAPPLIPRLHNQGMRVREEARRTGRFLSRSRAVIAELARRLHSGSPTVQAFRAFGRRVPWRLLLLLVGFVIQAGLVLMVWQLVELCISLLEAWVMLARHSLESWAAFSAQVG